MRSIVGILVLILAAPVYQSYAVTLDTVTSVDKGAAGTTATVSHTVTASGGNRAIVVACSLRSTTITLTATYGGVSMTDVFGGAIAGSSTELYVFVLANPATGANNWVVTQSSAATMLCWAASATDVNQATPISDSDSTTAGSTSDTLTLTTATNELLLDALAINLESAATTPGANQTALSTLPLQSGTTTMTLTGSSQVGADGGVMSFSWTGAADDAYAAIALAHDAFTDSSFGPLRRRK